MERHVYRRGLSGKSVYSDREVTGSGIGASLCILVELSGVSNMKPAPQGPCVVCITLSSLGAGVCNGIAGSVNDCLFSQNGCWMKRDRNCWSCKLIMSTVRNSVWNYCLHYAKRKWLEYMLICATN